MVALVDALSDQRDLWGLALNRSLTVLGATVGMNLMAFGIVGLAAGFGGRAPWRNGRSLRSFGLKLLGANLILPLMVVSILSDGGQLILPAVAVPFVVILGLGFLMLAGLAVRHGLQLEADSATDVLRRDQRPPVLYLRAFNDDREASVLPMGRSVAGRTMGRLFSLGMTAEQELVSILGEIGPVIAIGRPGESLPELGAARLYVDDSAWQATVTDMMRRAALVLIRVGESQGVRWEIDQATENLPLERLMLLLVGDAAGFRETAAILQPLLGAPIDVVLPIRKRSRWMRALGRTNPRWNLGAIVCFPNNQAHVEPIRQWPPRWSLVIFALMLRGNAAPLRGALRRTFEFLGWSWRRRPNRLVAIFLAVLFGAFGAHWFYLGRRRRAWIHIALLGASAFLAWVQALIWLWQDGARFDAKYADSRSRPR